jgi:hypothetical protein
LIKSFIRSNKFSKYLIQNSYPIAIDGTQKLVRDGYWWPDEWLGRSGEAGGTAWEQQYVYVLEANPALTHESIAHQKKTIGHKVLFPDKSLLRQYFTQLHA